MSYLVANIPPIEVYVDKKFLYDFQTDSNGNLLGDGEWERGHWVSAKSIPNRALLFETYIDCIDYSGNAIYIRTFPLGH